MLSFFNFEQVFDLKGDGSKLVQLEEHPSSLV